MSHLFAVDVIFRRPLEGTQSEKWEGMEVSVLGGVQDHHGDTLHVALADARLIGRLVGRIEETMSPPVVYRLTSPDAPGTHWRVGLSPGSDSQAVGERLVAGSPILGLPGTRVVTERNLRQSTAGHLLVLQRTLACLPFGAHWVRRAC